MNSKEKWDALKLEIIDKITDIYNDYEGNDDPDWLLEMVEICGIISGGDL